MYKAFLIFFLSAVVIESCTWKAFTKKVNEECVKRKVSLWSLGNKTDTPLLSIEENAWYRDSVGITQVCSIKTESTDSTRIMKIITEGYRLVDLRRKWAYEYKSFSDTATVLKKYSCKDTILPGGWLFLNRSDTPVDTFELMKDTTINKVVYGRCKIETVFNDGRFRVINLFRCDNLSSIFNMDAKLSARVGCPIVATYWEPEDVYHAKTTEVLNTISNKFPDSVLKIFSAWIQNEKKYPVN